SSTDARWAAARATASWRAPGERAETTTGSGVGLSEWAETTGCGVEFSGRAETTAGLPEWAGAEGGAAIAPWTLAPPRPKEVTATAVPAAVGGRGRGRVTTVRPRPSKSMAGLSVEACRDGGMVRCRSTSRALNRPGMPEAGSRWPRFVLTEPIGRGPAERAVP